MNIKNDITNISNFFYDKLDSVINLYYTVVEVVLSSIHYFTL